MGYQSALLVACLHGARAAAVAPEPSAELFGYRSCDVVDGEVVAYPTESEAVAATCCYGCAFPEETDFSGLDLRKLNLENADMTKAKFNNAILTEVNFHNSVLTGATFKGAELALARLKGADIQLAKFEGVDFSGTDLDAVTADYAIFDEANLVGTPMTDSSFVGVSFKGAYFENNALEGIVLDGADFTAATLTNMGGFTDIQADGVTMDYAKLSYITMTDTNMSSTTFYFAEFTDVSFEDFKGTGAAFCGAKFLIAPGSSTGPTFKDMFLKDADFKGVVFEKFYSEDSKFYGTDLTGATFLGGNIADAKFGSAKMDYVTFHDAIVDATFAADFDFSSGEGATTAASMMYANFSGSTTLFGADFTDVDLLGATFVGLSLEKAVFDGANLASANFSGSVCVECSFIGATLVGADFSKANLDKATLAGADVSGALFAEAKLPFGGVEGSAFEGTKNVDKAYFEETDTIAAFPPAPPKPPADCFGGETPPPPTDVDPTSCPVCGISTKNGNPNCCSPGGSWYGACSDGGVVTGQMGYDICKGRVAIDPTVCAVCGISTKNGNPNCCSPGGSWYGMCGEGSPVTGQMGYDICK